MNHGNYPDERGRCVEPVSKRLQERASRQMRETYREAYEELERRDSGDVRPLVHSAKSKEVKP